MDTDSLLHACTVQAYQGSGPGGQHRNKTQTGVSLRLAEFNLEIRCCEDRSASINRSLALQRMRIRLALEAREIPPEHPAMNFPGSHGRVQPTNMGYAPFIADVLDRIEVAAGEIKPAAEAWKLSTTALLRLIFDDKALLTTVQEMRTRFGKTPLRAPGK